MNVSRLLTMAALMASPIAATPGELPSAYNQTTVADALAKAQSNGKPVLVYFFRNG